ncbi:unnamed protein product [Ranitomeya imitator]|uniref:Uncharacterized protein n=1 Tax=Ranitomeya imitator TaxID=111125 RepID=A0ABN9KRG8_9NEOB|nr:unnamed protein product [Ranitomeya imitator]
MFCQGSYNYCQEATRCSKGAQSRTAENSPGSKQDLNHVTEREWPGVEPGAWVQWRQTVSESSQTCQGVYTFLSSTLESLEDTDQIHLILDKIIDTLVHFMAKTGLSLQQQQRRLAQLLLILSHIRHMR